MILNEDQKKAIEMACQKKFSLITGGAGTGKTTIIKQICQNINMDVRLCAPTGKAAARLREASGINASTIHSLLMLFQQGDKKFSKKLHKCAVIVDESSMVDSWLMSEIIQSEPEKIILIGDSSQLFPVGYGAPFHDLIEIRPDIVTELKICYRNKEAVNKASNMIRIGEIPSNNMQSENEKWTFQQERNPESVQEQIVEWVKSGVIDFDQDIVIVPKNGNKNDEGAYQPCTVKGLNQAIMNAINPHRKKKFCVGDRVMCLKNFSAKDVWNGTTGKIKAIEHKGDIWVTTDTPVIDDQGDYTNEVLFDSEMRDNLTHAYAITCHKSQGSQYRNVIFVALQRDKMMLERSLIYTAVTRTKKNCLIIGDNYAFSEGIKNRVERKTILKQLARQK